MKKWLKISCLLCVFGFFKELAPSEPYNAEYLLGPWRNVTHEEVNREVYPVGTYSYVAQLVIVFLVTDFLRYKPLIIATGIAGILVWSILIWTTSLRALQVSEFFYGSFLAAEVAYYTYIYAKVDKKHYQKVTSHTRAATFTGKLVASLSAQILLYFKLMDYKELNYITLAAQIIATVWALGLPKVESSLYFHRDNSSEEDSKETSFIAVEKAETKVVRTNGDTKVVITENSVNEAELTAFQLLWSHFRNAYTNVKVIQWSIWYAVSLCGFLMVYTYSQVLWKEIEPDIEVAWNGAVDAALTALAALSALGAGYIHNASLEPRAKILLVAFLSTLEGGAILLSCSTQNIYISYIGYIFFGALYAFSITIASAEVARYLEEDSFGLVFGINTLLASIMQTILTIAVISDTGFALTARGQFIVYAFYFISFSFLFFIFVLVEYFISIITSRRKNLSAEIELEKSSFLEKNAVAKLKSFSKSQLDTTTSSDDKVAYNP